MEDSSFEKDKEKLAENKLIILYLLKKANCTLTNLQIQRLLYDFEDFNYYYYQHIISELVSQNYIANYQQDEEWLYDITTQGKEVLDLTSYLLPGIVKDKLDKIIKEQLFIVQNEVAVTSHKALFELNIYCATSEQAKIVAENWKLHANEYYPKIIEMIANKDSEQ